jgi:hypothetical protein
MCHSGPPCTSGSVSLRASSRVELEPQLRDSVASYANVISSALPEGGAMSLCAPPEGGTMCSPRGWGYA